MNKLKLTEREMMEDGLKSQKLISSGYNAFAGECSSEQLRSTFLSILTEEQNLGAEIFNAINARGWYQTKEADASDIQKVKQKFIKN